MKSIWRIIRSIIFEPSPDSTGLDESDVEKKSNGDQLRELYRKAAETSLLILNEDGTVIDSKGPSRCSECGGNGYSRKTKVPEWRCRKCGHEWQSDGQPA
jgi:predicted Zn-ribbon and HTH transcriptional regulator